MALPADPRTTRKPKQTRPAAPTGLPAAPTYDIGALMAGLPKYPSVASLRPGAHLTAAAQTAATVRALRAQQAQINQQAALQAQQINQATLAGANFLNGLGLADKLQSGLSYAAADQAALASGYSGGLQQTMADQGAKVQQGLAAIGGPGGVPSTAAQAGNVLYGLGGALPASALLAGAPYAAAAARALPATMLGTGQQAAFGALGAGRTEAARLNPQIGEAIAGLPALEASTLAGLQKQAADARNDAIANMWKAVQVSQAGDSAEATRLWRNAQLKAAEAKRLADAAKPVFKTLGDTTFQVTPKGLVPIYTQPADPHWTSGEDAKGQYSYNTTTREKVYTGGASPRNPVAPSDTAQTASPRFDGPNSAKLGKKVDQYGNDILMNGKTQLMPGWKRGKNGEPVKKGSDATKGRALSSSQVQHLRSGIANDFLGVPEHLDENGDTVAALEPMSYQDAILDAIRHGYSLADAKKMANRFYKPGVRGRPGGAPNFFANPTATVAAAVGNG